MERDGNGWVECARGHRHWGLHGAAGLLLHAVDDAGEVRVLLQHRADWSHHGGTWGLPGGARDSHEDAVGAALREAAEETGLDRRLLRTRHSFVDDHGGWSYTTVYADTPAPLPTTLTHESVELAWLTLDAVTDRQLHPGFAATWPQTRAEAVTLLVDVANVVGSRPDGWWRDRAAAASRLLAALGGLRAVTVSAPSDGTWVVSSAVAVVEGAARAVPKPDWVELLRAKPGEGDGDDVLVAAAGRLLAEHRRLLGVTADRGLRARLAALDPRGADDADDVTRIEVVGPGWLLDLLP